MSSSQAMENKRTMPYVRLGNSGLKVSKLILGTAQYGSPEWSKWLLGEEEAIKHIKVAYDAGIQTFDTANSYSNGLCEVILGKAIKQLRLPREEIVVMTKLYHTVVREVKGNFASSNMNPDEFGYVNQHGLSRKHIFDSIKASLERLQLDYVDVLQCHRFDSNTPIEETMHALHDVVKAGYARYIGMSSCWAWQFHAMQNYAINNKLTPFISMQNHHSLLYREEEREMFPTIKLFDVGCIPWSPLAGGLLTRPFSEITRRGSTDWFLPNYYKSESAPEIIKRVEEIAKKRGICMAQVALAWSLSKKGAALVFILGSTECVVGVTAPIVGTSSLQNLEELIAAIHIELSEDEMKYLEEPYRAQAIIGHT